MPSHGQSRAADTSTKKQPAATGKQKPGDPAETVSLDAGRSSYGRSTLERQAEDEQPAEKPAPLPAAPSAPPPPKPTAPTDFDTSTEVRLPPTDEDPEQLAAGDGAATLPVHTRIRAVLAGTIDSAFTSAVTAIVSEPVVANGVEIFPAGTRFEGQADTNTQAKRIYCLFTTAVLPTGEEVRIRAEAEDTDLTTGLVADKEFKNRTQSYLGAFARGAVRRAANVGNTVTGGAVGDAGQLGQREITDATKPRRTYQVFAGRQILVCLTSPAQIPVPAEGVPDEPTPGATPRTQPASETAEAGDQLGEGDSNARP